MVPGKSKSIIVRKRSSRNSRNRSAAKTIFITGATGFLGSHFLELSKNYDWKLRCLARKLPRKNKFKHVEWVKGDLQKIVKWKHVLKDCDIIIHLATMPLLETDKKPIEAFRTILGSTQKLISLGRKYGVSRFIIASTGEAYGSPKKLPVKETQELSPLSFYGFLKACSDLYALKEAQKHSLSLTILRFFNIYGLSVENKLPPIVIKSFAEQLIANKPIVLHASKKNSRDFIHVRDAAQSIIQSILQSEARGVINIGSGKETFLKDLATRIAKILHKKLVIEFRPNEGRKRRLQADCTLARDKLSFYPKVSLDQGLREMLKPYSSKQ
jgi:UDP-glucose 4-epimerase